MLGKKIKKLLQKKTKAANSFKRQWGSETQTTPLPYLHAQPSTTKIAFSRLAIVLTVLFWMMYVVSVILRELIEGAQSYRFFLEEIGYLTTVTVLTFSALMYLVARQGALQRFAKHMRVPRALLDKHFANNRPGITVLVPSYSEEPGVVRKTLLSAALQEYPDIRVVLLIDDDPHTTDKSKQEKLATTRALCEDIKKLLAKPHHRFEKALKKYKKDSIKKNSVKLVWAKTLAGHYYWAAEWLEKLANDEDKYDHVDVFFDDQVLGELAGDLRQVGDALMEAYKDKVKLSRSRLRQLHQRLVWIFGAKMSVFERKKYISLSHEPNKAMNLNSYIGLMGGKYIEEETPDGTILTPTQRKRGKILDIPDNEFLLSLDADSILLRDYCLRLVYFLQQPNNADVAVTQTPYSSFRGAATRIERLSGATTDIQHILHQGMSYYGATFWVGANAVIRKKALEEIVINEWQGGFEIKRYIQDNTVIEDTESSIDLTYHGWRLVNYPERLSYSATPPDFGALIVQRRRWANGGLLILPKLWNQVKLSKSKGQQVSQVEILLRLNYMASIAWSNLGLVFLLVYPYDGRLLSPWVLLAALPYFLTMASDLKYCRYKYSDIVRIYGFNLILLPVNLAGVLKSLQQAITSKKIPFARTPKVKNRTTAALPYVLAPILIVGFSLFTLWRNIEEGSWGNAAFAGFNATAATWAMVSFIGLGNMLMDIWLGLTNFLYVEVPVVKKQTKSKSEIEQDWKVVLYHGEKQGYIPHGTTQDLLVETSN